MEYGNKLVGVLFYGTAVENRREGIELARNLPIKFEMTAPHKRFLKTAMWNGFKKLQNYLIKFAPNMDRGYLEKVKVEHSSSSCLGFF